MSNDPDNLPCPHCGHILRDLWDYDWGATNSNVMISECEECTKPIDIIRHQMTWYEIKKG